MVLEKTLESPLDCKEIQPVHPKENQSWIFIGRTDAEAETPILWSPDVKNWLIGKDPDAGKDWRWEKGMTEDEMVDIASPTQCTWVWVSSGSWWWTGRPGVLQSMEPQRVRHDRVTELNWTEERWVHLSFILPSKTGDYRLQLLRKEFLSCLSLYNQFIYLNRSSYSGELLEDVHYIIEKKTIRFIGWKRELLSGGHILMVSGSESYSHFSTQGWTLANTWFIFNFI